MHNILGAPSVFAMLKPLTLPLLSLLRATLVTVQVNILYHSDNIKFIILQCVAAPPPLLILSVFYRECAFFPVFSFFVANDVILRTKET